MSAKRIYMAECDIYVDSIYSDAENIYLEDRKKSMENLWVAFNQNLKKLD